MRLPLAGSSAARRLSEAVSMRCADENPILHPRRPSCHQDSQAHRRARPWGDAAGRRRDKQRAGPNDVLPRGDGNPRLSLALGPGSIHPSSAHGRTPRLAHCSALRASPATAARGIAPRECEPGERFRGASVDFSVATRTRRRASERMPQTRERVTHRLASSGGTCAGAGGRRGQASSTQTAHGPPFHCARR